MRTSFWVGALVTVMLASMSCSAAALEFVQPAGSPFATTDPAYAPSPGGFLGREAVGDFNGDGISDVAVVDQTGEPVFSPGESVTVLLGSRSGALSIAPGSPVALYSGGMFSTRGPIATADFNGDGNLDLAVIDERSDTVSILLGNGKGEFKLVGSPIPYSGDGQASIVVGDFNRPGTEDLAIADSELNILLGNGSGSFTPAPGSPLAIPARATSLVAGDFNGDYLPDLAVATEKGELAGDVAVYLSSGGGQFQPAPWSPYAIEGGPSAIAAGHLTGGGAAPLDLATANESGTATVLLGDGAGGFRPAPGSPFTVPAGSGAAASSPGIPRSIAVADFSCDGNADLAVANWNGSSDNVAILQGDGSGGFTNAAGSPFPANGNPEPIAAGDFNGDGKPDIAVGNSFLGRVTVLENASKSCEPLSPTPQSPVAPRPERWVPGPSDRAGAPVIESLRALRARRGVTLEVALSHAGSVLVELDRYVYVYGRRRLKLAGKLTLSGTAGANRFAITRIAGHALARGSYVLLVFAKLGAELTPAHSIRVTVGR